MTGRPAGEYWAFISYSHQDKSWGDWLHKALETYRVPARLRGRVMSAGVPVPTRLNPIFRDREELPTATNLGQTINDALARSRTLVVICSPRSARSHWVDEEIRTFQRMGRADRILCLIVDGEPNAGDKPAGGPEECFPEAIRFTLDGTRTEPIAADARPGKDGRRDAKLKLIAGILGVSYDELKQRELQRRQRMLAVVTGSALVLVVIMGVLTAWALVAHAQAESARSAEADQRLTAQRREREARRTAAFALYERSFSLEAEGDVHRAAACLLRALEVSPYPPEPGGITGGDPGWAEEAWRRFRLMSPKFLQFNEPLDVHVGPGGLACFDVSPDGSTGLEGCGNGLVRLRDLRTGTETAKWRGHEGYVSAVAFDATGLKLMSVSSDGVVRVWDASTRERLHQAEGIGADGPRLFSPDGRTFVSGGPDGSLIVWDTATWQERRRLAVGGDVYSVAFGREILVSAGVKAGVVLWDTSSGAQVRRFSEPSSQIGLVALSPDGTRIAGSSVDGTVRMWDVATGSELWRRENGAANVTVALSFRPDGSALVGARTDWTLDVLDAGTGERILRLPGHEAKSLLFAGFDAAGAVFVTGGDGGDLRIWRTRPARRETVVEGLKDGMRRISFSTDATVMVASGMSGALQFIDPQGTVRSRQKVIGHIAVAYHFAERAAFGIDLGGGVILWDLTAGKEIAQLDRAMTDAAFSPDGTKLAMAELDNNVHVLSMATLEDVAQWAGHQDNIIALAYHPRGALAMTGSNDWTAIVWDTATGLPRRRLEGHRGPVWAVALNSDSTLALTGSADGTLRLWNVETGREVRRYLGHRDAVMSVSFGFGDRVVLSGSRDRTVRLWDAATGKELLQLSGFTGEVYCAAFDPRGTVMIGGSADGTIRWRELADDRVPATPPSVRPGDAEPYREFGSYYRWLGFRPVREGPAQGGFEPITTASQEARRHAEALIARAELRTRFGDGAPAAIADYTRAIELDRNAYQAHYGRALLRRGAGDPRGADDDLTRCVELNPLFAPGYILRAETRAGLGDRDGALRDCATTIEIEPREWHHYQFRAGIKKRFGDAEGALDDMTRAIEVSDFPSGATADRGDHRLAAGDAAGALEDYAKAIELDPENARAKSRRGLARVRLKDYAGANEDLTLAIENFDGSPEIHGARGEARLALGDFAGAIADLERALEQSDAKWPDRARVEGLLAEARKRVK